MNNGNNIESIKDPTATFGSIESRTSLLIYTIYGIVELQYQKYIIAVTKAEFAANLAGKNIYLATEFTFIGLNLKDQADDAVSGIC